MTRLVVHAGTHATDWSAIQSQLVASRGHLESLGVHLDPADDAATWAAASADLAETAPPDRLDAAARTAIQDGAEMLLVSAERLEDALRDPTQVANIESFARDHGMRLTVLVVVRDQIGYLNELYCERVTRLHTARDFSSFAAAPQPQERFDYDSAFDAVLGLADVDFVAVPYASLPDGSQARALLVAAGVPAAELAALPPGASREPLPGPYAVAAIRLLYKRLWRLGMFKSLPRTQLLDAAATLRGHAVDAAWDETAFWGWSERARKEAVQRFRPSNDAFAAVAWGRRWGDDWADGEYVDVDLAASPPSLVVDVLQAVDARVKELQASKAALVAEPAGKE